MGGGDGGSDFGVVGTGGAGKEAGGQERDGEGWRISATFEDIPEPTFAVFAALQASNGWKLLCLTTSKVPNAVMEGYQKSSGSSL